MLTEKEKNILSLIYMKELKEGEIAMSLNISQQAVSKTKRRALQKIREMVRKDEKNETTSASKTNSRR
ncbi:sigma factor-like helix-turn-helix DNA-binding protein [Brevibacillus reuszeri]|uniref:sigma factor-like helix-turn-helix DNA-binding protein n=1 Tax=Brevibacillus reuszeri TaxID=54915 RepID=UPI0013DF07D7